MATWTYTIGPGYYYNHYALPGNATNVKNYLTSRGFSQAAIIGIVANMEHESCINPGQQEHGYDGSTSRGYGLVQWTPASTKILAYAAGLGADWWDGDIQMDYLMVNMPQSWIPSSRYPVSYNEYKNMTDIYDATAAFFYNFERGTWHQDLYDYANYWNNYLYGGVTPPTPPDPPVPPPSPEPVDDDFLLWLAIFMSKMLR